VTWVNRCKVCANALHCCTGQCLTVLWVLVAGRPSFVHYFILRFVWKPSANLQHIWSHGKVPNPAVKRLPDCGAKQLLFSRLGRYLYAATYC